MKTSNIIAAAAIALFAAAGAHAETYEGVHPLTNQRSRAEVAAEATVAAHSANPYADGANDSVVAATNGTVDRGVVRAEAVAKAHDPFASLDRRAFYRDTVPAQYNKVRRPAEQRQAALQSGAVAAN
ncbi:alpha/beta hydrolase [Variovorax rhizosphaerae]|uniref:Alpha/beta hydrolase n=1 Tax=Variovorax rhizosphaerae TaxID=1836200 RepID=A0ABU8WDW9_9BURK